MTRNLIDRLEQILPGIQNSNSQAEVAMVEVLPEVIAELKSYSAPALHRLMAERDAMAEALFQADAVCEHAAENATEPAEGLMIAMVRSRIAEALESSK